MLLADLGQTLFERHGLLLFESWMDRVTDYGCAGLLGEGDAKRVSFHRQ